MNLTSGKFTAPRDGTYSFSFTGVAQFLDSTLSTRRSLYVSMYLNGYKIGRTIADEISTSLQEDTLLYQATFNLQMGDQIWLAIDSMSPGTLLYDNDVTHFNYFSGWLLEENISQSLSVMRA